MALPEPHVSPFTKTPIAAYRRLLESEVFPRLLGALPHPASKAGLRVWIPEAGSGEEGYVLLAALLEALEARGQSLPIRMIVTTTEKLLLGRGRAGLFPLSAFPDLPESWRGKYFTEVSQRFEVRPELRALCLFSRHALHSDPPYHKMDLISVFSSGARLLDESPQGSLSRFAYALRPGGLLLIDREFAEVEGFQPLEGARTVLARAQETPSLIDVCSDRMRRFWIFGEDLLKARSQGNALRLPGSVRAVIEARLLRTYVPPSAILDDNFYPLYLSEGLSPFLLIPSNGGARKSLPQMARKPVADDLRLVLDDCWRRNAPIRRDGIRFSEAEPEKMASIEVSPFASLHAGRFFLVTFNIYNEPAAIRPLRVARQPVQAISNGSGPQDASIANTGLMVGTDIGTVTLVREGAAQVGLQLSEAANLNEARHLLSSRSFRLVFFDLDSFSLDAEQALDFFRGIHPSPMVTLLTGRSSLELALSAFRLGALDVMQKPLDSGELRRLFVTTSGLTKALPSPAPTTTNDDRFIGRSRALHEVFKSIARAATCDSPVLITGETGTGKELIAKAIHHASPRARRKCLTLNCGALVETLLESELFGHVRGSFTGAVSNKAGLFEVASEGTLFLDEVGDLPLSLQVKLLRVLQEGEYRPVGSTEVRKSNARIMAATHRDLRALIAEGKFREDLYYRLNVIGIYSPPLRERREDLPDLVHHLLARLAAKLARPVPALSDEAMQCLLKYDWPGNIRELENSLERAIALSTLPILHPEDFPTQAMAPGVAEGEEDSGSPTLVSLEKERIIEALKRAHFNKSLAAELLGVSRVTLYRKAKLLGLG